MPLGSFRAYYRVSDDAKYALQPADMSSIQIDVPYLSVNGSQQTLTINLGLKSSIYNSAATESNDSIKEKAPQVYYAQNRMITAEDYQVVPLSASQEIIKVKSVNRSASGISIISLTGLSNTTEIVAQSCSFLNVPKFFCKVFSAFYSF